MLFNQNRRKVPELSHFLILFLPPILIFQPLITICTIQYISWYDTAKMNASISNTTALKCSRTHISTLYLLLPIIPTLLTAFIQVALKYLTFIRVGFTHTQTRVHHNLHISSGCYRNNQLVGKGVPNHCSIDEKKYRNPTGKVATWRPSPCFYSVNSFYLSYKIRRRFRM